MEDGGAGVHAQAQALGAAMGRYHARLRHATCLELHAALIIDPGHDGLAAFMAGYLATPGVAAALARIEACSVQPDINGAFGTGGDYALPPVVWTSLAPHLTRLCSLSVTIADWGTPPLDSAEDLVTLLPASTQLRSLVVRLSELPEPEDSREYSVDWAGNTSIRWLQQLCGALRGRGHDATIKRLGVSALNSASASFSTRVFNTLAKALPAVEVLEVLDVWSEDDLGVALPAVLGVSPPHLPLALEAAAGAGDAAQRWPRLHELRASHLTASLAQLDAACAVRPALRAIHGLVVNITPTCMLHQTAYPHVEQLAVVQGPSSFCERGDAPRGAAVEIRNMKNARDRPRTLWADGGDGAVSDRVNVEAFWWGICQQEGGNWLRPLPAVLSRKCNSVYLQLSLSQRIMAHAVPGGTAEASSVAVDAARVCHAVSAQEAAACGGRGSGSGSGSNDAGGDTDNTSDTAPLLQHLAGFLKPVLQGQARRDFSLYLKYHFKSDGSESREAAQDALLAACRALQPSRVFIDMEGRHSRSPTGPRACRFTPAVEHWLHVAEEAAWVRFARSAAAALPWLQQLSDVLEPDGLLEAIWMNDSGRRGFPMASAFRAARQEAA